MSARVFLAAGHELGGGAAANGLRENPYNAFVGALAVARLRERGIEAELAPLSRRGYPDDIHAKVGWLNERAAEHDLVVDIHLDIGEPGCAAFTIDREPDRGAGTTLAQAIAERTGLACRGARPERETAPGRLGFLHSTRCRALLVELCSMNTADAEFAHRPGAPLAFAEGLRDGCASVLGR